MRVPVFSPLLEVEQAITEVLARSPHPDTTNELATTALAATGISAAASTDTTTTTSISIPTATTIAAAETTTEETTAEDKATAVTSAAETARSNVAPGPINPFTNQVTAYDEHITAILVPVLERYPVIQMAHDRATTLLETAFKLKLLLIQDELGTSPSELNEAVFHCMDALLRCSELDLVDSGAPLNCLEEVFELQTVECSEQIYNYLESRLERLTVNMIVGRGKGLTLLRLCNELLRRLSKAKNTVLCGRILVLLASAYPLTERSGVNLRGEFNTANVTLVEGDDPAVVVPELSWTSFQMQGGEEARVPNGESMDVDEQPGADQGQSRGPTPNDALKSDSMFYVEFWRLQAFFCDPPTLFKEPANLARLKRGVEHAMERFATIENAEHVARGQRVDDSGSPEDLKSASTLTIEQRTKTGGSVSIKRKHSQVSNAEPTTYFPKFLTSSKLLQLEMADPYFRKHILVQFLIILQYMENQSVAAKDAYANIAVPNRSFQPHWVLEEDDQAWATSVRPKILKQLRAIGDESGDRDFLVTVDAVLNHEESWIQWKAENCQSFERPPLTANDVALTRRKRQRLAERLQPFRQRLGCASLSDLWTEVEEENSGLGSNRTPPTAGEYAPRIPWLTQRVLGTRMAQGRPVGAQEAKELEQARLWKGLRLGAQQYLHLYGTVADPSYTAAKLIADIKADDQWEETIKENDGKVPKKPEVEKATVNVAEAAQSSSSPDVSQSAVTEEAGDSAVGLSGMDEGNSGAASMDSPAVVAGEDVEMAETDSAAASSQSGQAEGGENQVSGKNEALDATKSTSIHALEEESPQEPAPIVISLIDKRPDAKAEGEAKQ